MIRSVLGVIVGYVAMFILVMIALTVAYLAMGADRAFKPASFEPSLLWIIVMGLVGFVAAILGGLACVAIARNRKAPKALAILVFILGVLMAIPAAMSDTEPGVRSSDLSSFEAMNEAQTPLWVALLNPVIGAVGVLVGGRLVRPRGRRAASAESKGTTAPAPPAE